jgi:hypothetical protein
MTILFDCWRILQGNGLEPRNVRQISPMKSKISRSPNPSTNRFDRGQTQMGISSGGQTRFPVLWSRYEPTPLGFIDLNRSTRSSQLFTFLSGPAVSGKSPLLRTWTPASCSPLKGVTVPGPPALTTSCGLLNHRPK